MTPRPPSASSRRRLYLVAQTASVRPEPIGLRRFRLARLDPAPATERPASASAGLRAACG